MRELHTSVSRSIGFLYDWNIHSVIRCMVYHFRGIFPISYLLFKIFLFASIFFKFVLQFCEIVLDFAQSCSLLFKALEEKSIAKLKFEVWEF